MLKLADLHTISWVVDLRGKKWSTVSRLLSRAAALFERTLYRTAVAFGAIPLQPLGRSLSGMVVHNENLYPYPSSPAGVSMTFPFSADMQ